MIIDLKSIEEEGKDYSFSETSEELEGAFVDLIGDKPFRIQVNIKPLGNTFQLLGSLSAEYPEVCSKCGYEIDVPLVNKINEIVVIEKKRPRNTAVSQSKQNFNEDGPAVTYLNDGSLNLTEFLHEIMASGQNLYPKCQDEKLCESRQVTKHIVEEGETKGHPGFAALKDFKTTKH